ncbi:MAG: ComF family protein [Candidatus Mariimomonas ferrooxydans]
MINRMLRIFFPEFCPVCKKPSTDHYTAPICPDCWQKIQPYRGHICNKCGKPLVFDVTACGNCIKDEPVFKSARSFGIYEGSLKTAINIFKYHHIKRLAKPLSNIILRSELPLVDVIIPVSLHKKRLRQKEFNQSALIAKNIAKALGIPMIVDCLIKIRDTIPQVGLSAKDRKKNIKNTFGLKKVNLIKGKNIMLVDDVYTTGATARECSKVLRKAGINDIYVITLAHSRGD